MQETILLQPIVSLVDRDIRYKDNSLKIQLTWVAGFICILGVGILVAIYANARTSSEARVITCFRLNQLRETESTKSQLEEMLNAKVPTGTPRSKVERLLQEGGFHRDDRNWTLITKEDGRETLHCFFGGGGLLEVVFREYVVSFHFNGDSKNLEGVDVNYGITGL